MLRYIRRKLHVNFLVMRRVVVELNKKSKVQTSFRSHTAYLKFKISSPKSGLLIYLFFHDIVAQVPMPVPVQAFNALQTSSWKNAD